MPIGDSPLRLDERPDPRPGRGQLLLRVKACGVCHTDLHLAEGDIKPPRFPVTPGHQVVGVVAGLGEGVHGWALGERAGIPWLHSACRECEFCRRGEENLCEQASFTGFDVDGGYADLVLANADYALHIPAGIQDQQAAPLLCAGIVGYRSLRKADLQAGERIGLVGFGASGHLALQVARHWGCEVYVFTRGSGHRQLATELGAAWVGGVDDEPPSLLDRAVIFAPVGSLVPAMLAKLRSGGTLATNAIHMSPIPELPYRLIDRERTLRSVANATYLDGVEFLKLAAAIPVRPRIKLYKLEQANQALQDLKAARIDGAGVLIP